MASVKWPEMIVCHTSSNWSPLYTVCTVRLGWQWIMFLQATNLLLHQTNLCLYGSGRGGICGWNHHLGHNRWHHHGTEEHAIAALLQSIDLLVEKCHHLFHHLDPSAECLDLSILHLTLKTAIEVVVLHSGTFATVTSFVLHCRRRISQITAATASLSTTAVLHSHCSGCVCSIRLQLGISDKAVCLGTTWLASTWHVHRLRGYSRVGSPSYLV